MKEQVTKFNLEAAFKALNEIEIPQVGGMKPNKDNHKELSESMKPTPKTDCLLEDYYDINNPEDLGAAQADRAEEVAQAKLAKIEKIVDLDAETPEDIQPSYVGKTIIQCPQCMTLFYRDPADVNVSEEDPSLVNVGEQCPNCNNDSGYTIIGKVAAEEPKVEEPAVEEGPAEEADELDLNFEEPVSEEENEEAPAEETSEEDLNLEPVEEPIEENEEEEEEKSEEEEEKKEESFEPHSENILAEQVENALKEETNVDELTKKLKEHDEYIKVLQDEIKAEEEAVKNAKNDFIKKMHEKNLESLKDALDKAIPEEVKAETAIEELPTAEDAVEDMTKNEALTEATAGDLVNGLKKLKNYENLSDTSLKKILALYKEDMSGDPEFKLKNASVEDVVDWVGSFDEFIDTFAEDIDMKLARDLAMNCPKIIAACRKEYARMADEGEKYTDKDAVEAIFEYSQEPDANNNMTVPEAMDSIKDHLKESLTMTEEKCPVCGDELAGKEPCEKCKKELEDTEELKESLTEEKCEICGKDVAEPCKSEEEAKECETKLDEAEMHIMDKKEFEEAAEEAGIEKPVDEAVCVEGNEKLEEDVIATEAPEEAKDIELEQRKVSEIHKDKEEHVPNSVVEESLTEAEIPAAEVEKMLDSEEFKTPVSEAEVEALLADEPVKESCDKSLFESIDEIKDEAIENCITESLTNVYENVDTFRLTNCELQEGKLTISGDITFKSGNVKPTTYIFTEAEVNENNFRLVGINESLDKDGTFALNGILEDGGSLLIAEGLSYNYHINDNLVEGFVQKD